MPRHKRILCVDDDWMILYPVRDLLEIHNYRVFLLDRSHNVPAAIDAVQPDLAIIDVMMPVKDGYRVIGEITEIGYKLPLIILTGLSLPHTLGGHAVLKKEELFILDRLVNLVVSIIGFSEKPR